MIDSLPEDSSGLKACVAFYSNRGCNRNNCRFSHDASLKSLLPEDVKQWMGTNFGGLKQ